MPKFLAYRIPHGAYAVISGATEEAALEEALSKTAKESFHLRRIHSGWLVTCASGNTLTFSMRAFPEKEELENAPTQEA